MIWYASLLFVILFVEIDLSLHVINHYVCWGYFGP